MKPDLIIKGNQYYNTLKPRLKLLQLNGFRKQGTVSGATDSVYFSVTVPCAIKGGLETLTTGCYFKSSSTCLH